jgi:DNA-directed RNA polymerase beta' subunit
LVGYTQVEEPIMKLPRPEERSLETWTRMLWNRRQRLARLKTLNAPDVIIAREEELIQKALDGMAEVRARSRNR